MVESAAERRRWTALKSSDATTYFGRTSMAGTGTGPEFDLKRSLVQRSVELLPDFPYCIDDEWEVVPGKANMGRGDLVFSDGQLRYAVVEVKYLDFKSTGRTAQAKRNDARSKVVNQALEYADHFRARAHPEAQVEPYTFTNEYKTPTPVAR